MSANRDRYRTDFDDRSGRTYVCDCGNEYMNEETLRQHQQTPCQKRFTACSFCDAKFPSPSNELREHLLLCGNKTDECPICRQFIRRSHFAYHYENNCAPVNEVETPPLPRRRSPVHPPNSNQPVLRIDIPDENSPKTNGRIQTPRSNPRNPTVVIECQFCRHACAKNDYDTHINNCLKNPKNSKSGTRIPLGSNENNARDTTHLPCEFCDQSVDIANWSRHTAACREREEKRLTIRARQISREPVTEQIPCEYCQKQFSAEQFEQHQNNCLQDPDRVEAAARMARPGRAQRVVLPVRPRNNSGARTRDVQYQIIDHDQTRLTNQEEDERRRIINRSPTRQRPSNKNPGDGYNHCLNDGPNDISRGSQDNLVLLDRQKPPANGTKPGHRRSFDDLDNIDRHEEQGRGPPYRRIRRGHSAEEIDNQHGRRDENKKKAWWKPLFCGLVS